MKLSNTILLNESLLPSNKKAFTLAEVLITLTILGVVAAITIPSLVNRQGEVAARTRLKKAIANYENVAAVYMVETESNTAKGLFYGTGGPGDYFKTVTTGTGTFTTSDGSVWYYPTTSANDTCGEAIVCDSASPTYCVGLWTTNVNGTGQVNVTGRAPSFVRTAPDSCTTAGGETAPCHLVDPNNALNAKGAWTTVGTPQGT